MISRVLVGTDNLLFFLFSFILSIPSGSLLRRFFLCVYKELIDAIYIDCIVCALLKVNWNSSSISSYVQLNSTQNQPLKSLLLENIVSPSKVIDDQAWYYWLEKSFYTIYWDRMNQWHAFLLIKTLKTVPYTRYQSGRHTCRDILVLKDW